MSKVGCIDSIGGFWLLWMTSNFPQIKTIRLMQEHAYHGPGNDRRYATTHPFGLPCSC
jgi:hypothetical protein